LSSEMGPDSGPEKRPVDTAGRRERARWRSRRGLLELELLLRPFADDGFDDLSDTGKSDYERLLDYDDLDVHEWLLGRAAPPSELTAIVAGIRRFLKLD